MQVVHIHNGFGVTFCLASKWANPHFAWVSPLVNFKKSLFSNKYKEVIANNGTNKGTSETKLCSHVADPPPPFFRTSIDFRIFLKSMLAQMCLKTTNYSIHRREELMQSKNFENLHIGRFN